MSGTINALNITSENITVTNLTVTNINGKPYTGSGGCGSYYTSCPSCDGNSNSEEPCVDCGSGEVDVDPCDCLVPDPCIGPQGFQGFTGATGAAGPGNSISATQVTSTSITPPAATALYPVLVQTTGAQIPYIANSATYALSYVPSTGTLNSQVINGASDIRIKQDIKPLKSDYSIEFLKKLNPVEYKFINDPTKKRFGLIAQEVEKMFKDENLGLHYKQIGEDGNDQHYLSYLELISPLINVVNDLVEKNTALEKRIEQLENK